MHQKPTADFRISRHLPRIAWFMLILLVQFGLFYLWQFKHPGSNPDQWFHYAVSKISAQQGLISKLPQAEDIGWGRVFEEKEFLFHQLTTLAYKVHGESAVQLLRYILAALVLLALYIELLPYTSPKQSAALLIVGAALVPYFSPRLSFLRPHVLAILCFTVLIFGFLKIKPWICMLGAALFVLAYHAFYVPLVPIFLAFFFGRRWRKCSALGLAGLIAGLLANPYFPVNLVIGLKHLKIALFYSSFAPGMEAGSELAPLPFEVFFRNFFPHFFILFAALLALLYRRSRKCINTTDQEIMFFGGAAAVFWFMALQSPRACEYAIPLTLVAGAAMVNLVKIPRWATVSCACVLAIFPTQFVVSELQSDRDPRFQDLTRSIQDAIAAIPKEAAGKKVFNCEWNLGSFLLYARPDMKFIDLLDPRFLLFESPSKYEALRQIKASQDIDVFPVARNLFKADYALCYRDNVNQALASDPDFTPIFSDGPVRLFSVQNEIRHEWVRQFDIRSLAPPTRFSATVQGRYLDLSSSPAVSSQGATSPGCFSIRPNAKEIKSHLGAEIALIGGGPEIRVLQNGKPLFTSDAPFPEARLIQVRLPLKTTLKKQDDLEFVVCRTDLSFFGFSLSLWRRAELSQFCRNRHLNFCDGFSI